MAMAKAHQDPAPLEVCARQLAAIMKASSAKVAPARKSR
jgi:hypothetical protein